MRIICLLPERETLEYVKKGVVLWPEKLKYRSTIFKYELYIALLPTKKVVYPLNPHMQWTRMEKEEKLGFHSLDNPLHFCTMPGEIFSSYCSQFS